MDDEQKHRILRSLQLVMRPIVKILLRYGIGINEFAEIAKTAFVDVATAEFGIRGRPTNISRVAVMTGMTRKEVRRIRTKLENGDERVTVKSTPLAEIIHRWYNEHDFLDQDGMPAVLPFLGEGRTFETLVKRFGGDVPPGAMRTELKRVNSIKELDNGDLELVRRFVVPDDETEYLSVSLVHSVYPLLSTVWTNSEKLGTKDGFPQFAVHSEQIPKGQLPTFRRMCDDRLRSFSKSLDDFFVGHERSGDQYVADSKDKPVVVGLFYFEERDDSADYEW